MNKLGMLRRVLSQFSPKMLDVMLLSETRGVEGKVTLEGGHWLCTTDDPLWPLDRLFSYSFGIRVIL